MSQNIVNNTEINQVTDAAIDALVKAFKDGLETMKYKGVVPDDERLHATARKLIEQEAKDFAIRKDALWYAKYGTGNRKDENDWKYPDPSECPLYSQELNDGDGFSEQGGIDYSDDPEWFASDGKDDIEENMKRGCMRDAYVDWFIKKSEYIGKGDKFDNMTPDKYNKLTLEEQKEYIQRGTESLNRWMEAGCPCPLEEWDEYEKKAKGGK
jgi:hypothetical protein